MAIDISADSETPSLFIGRDSELRALNAHFARDGRLAQINGNVGTGKTAFAMFFSTKAKRMFPGGVSHLYSFPPQSLYDLILEAIKLPIKKRTLVIVDELDVTPKAELSTIPQLLALHPLLDVILISQSPLDIPNAGMLSLSLGGLDEDSFHELIKRRLQNSIKDADLIEELYRLSQGNPLLAAAASRSIREGLLTFRQFLQAFRNFDYQAILGPDGKPLTKGIVVPKKVVVSVTAINSDLLKMLKSNPEIMRTLPPRKFEELVAELLEKHGYSVELTPASRDGGFDMYAARNDTLGQFLYLVECKRFSPPNKVGVQIVRALHGVVQQTRATAGIIATTSFFTDGAKEFQQDVKHQLHLHDYIELQRWLGIIK